MDFLFFCTGRKGAPHSRHDLGSIVDERTSDGETVDEVEAALTGLNQITAQLVPGQESSTEQLRGTAEQMVWKRNRLAIKGDRWFISQAGQRLTVPQQSSSVIVTATGRTFRLSCSTCGPPPHVIPEQDMERLVDHLRRSGDTQFDLGKSGLGLSL